MAKTYEALKRAEALRTKDKGPEVLQPVAPNGSDDAYELRRRLMAVSIRDSIRSVLVVSALHGEGTSSIACLLAKAMADHGRSRVLLVDMNFRTPSLWRLMSVTGPDGFANLVAERKEIGEVIQDTDTDGLQVITAGNGLVSAIDVIDNERTLQIVGSLTQYGDVVFVDAPPITLYPDARTLAPLVDGVVLVVEADATPVPVATRAAQIVRETGANLLGVVLNKRRDYIPANILQLIG